MESLLIDELGMAINPASKEGQWFADKNGYTVAISMGYFGRWEAGLEVTCYRNQKLLYENDFILDTENRALAKQVKSDSEVKNILKKDLGNIINGAQNQI